MGPFTTTSAGNRYICLAIDAHIKYVWFAATKSIDEISTVLFLFNEVVCKVGPIEKIMSDQGACFESNVFQHLCKLIGSKKLRSSAFHPAGNGGIEIVNKVVKPNMAKYVADSHDNWDVCLGMAINAYNNTSQSSIGMAPAEALYNRPPVLMADVICSNKLNRDTHVDNVSEYTLNLWNSAQRIRRDIAENKELAQRKQKANYDAYVKCAAKFVVGDKVKIKNYRKPQNVCKAFVEKFIGPFVITECLAEEVFRIEANGKSQVVHYNRLAKFYERDEVTRPGNEDELIEKKAGDIPFYSNMDNLTDVVFCYKSKLRRRNARALLMEMNPLDRGVLDLDLNDALEHK